MNAPKKDARAAAGDVEKTTCDAHVKPPPVSAQHLRERVERAIALKLHDAERKMTPPQWREHGDWVRALVVESARDWLRSQSAKGGL
ncbi:hypothetical protein AB4Y43_18260 [Paraburkholderia sp. BR10872]|uniref:hypothetical protein n=1 Tax=Paraburkholderia sp. BR10872 TaxID=3236989 RepID=UPI0034D17931